MQYKSSDHDIEKRCGRFHLRFHFLAPRQMMPNEVVRSYPLLQLASDDRSRSRSSSLGTSRRGGNYRGGRWDN
jgi:hypothetical protein